MALSESLLPVQTAALGGGRVSAKIVAGAEHACVLATDGTVWCWGRNGAGQLGVSAGNKLDPTQVTLGGAATLIAAGGANTCAVLVDNSLVCWGQNTQGQLGIGSADGTAHYTPATVTGIPGSFTVASLDIGTGHICASSTSNEVWCWGKNASGQVGNGATASVYTATRTQSLGGLATSVAAGAEHSCAVVGTGLMCFGRNNYGQIGQTVNATANSTPMAATVSGSVSKVSAGDSHSCLMLTTGAVQCLGRNNYLQLGRTTAGSTDSIPGAVQNLQTGAVEVVAGGSHTCALTPPGEVKCWGLNNYGQLGDNSQTDSADPLAVPYFNALPTTTTIATTTTTTVATTVPPTTVTPTIPQTTSTVSSNSVVPNATLPVANGSSSATSVRTLRIRKNRSATAAKIAASVSMKIPKRSQGSMRISITSGTRYCKFVGSTVRGLRSGTCTVTVVLIPKKGKPSVRTLKITVV